MKTKQDYNNNNIPLVSISCITYQHAPYIRQCLDGFMMQKTDFAFEVLIHDDASTDGTEEIIREYEAKYPDIIKPIYQTENQWVKGRRGSKTFNYPRAKGKYIALCEGDDYWTDPLKLQKQVDFMEENEDCSLCFHSANVISEIDYEYTSLDKRFSNIEGRYYSGGEILKTWTIPTASVVFRKNCLLETEHLRNHPDFLYGDIVLFLSMAECGKLYGMEDVMSVYRRHEGGVTQVYDPNKNFKRLKHHQAIQKKFPRYRKESRYPISSNYWSISRDYQFQKSYLKAVRYYCFSLFKSPLITLKRTLTLVKPYFNK